MSDAPPLSVVVASHGRPLALRRCLIALSQSTHRPLEVIAVADKTGLEAVASLPFADRIRTILQAEPNLSAARNHGIARALGDAVAFIDDDAVPEPTWARAVAAAFATDAGLAAVTGPVLGRNGISLQWDRIGVDGQGRDIPLSDGAPRQDADIALKLHGTNMAVRRRVLCDLGGFDPAFRFYLDDTDLSRRLHDMGAPMAYLPEAQVHHSFAASVRRTGDRVPLDLWDIGASTAIFLRKHAPDQIDGALDRLVEDQRARLFRLARNRKLGPREIEGLMRSLRNGIAEGRDHAPAGSAAIAPRADAFQDLEPEPGTQDTVLCGWLISARALRAEAQDLVRQGHRVTLILLDPTPRPHKVAFTDGGWWEQTGGLYGRSIRTEPRLQFWRFRSRIVHEVARVANLRFGNDPNLLFLTRLRNATVTRGL